jgi:hypothetical protein
LPDLLAISIRQPWAHAIVHCGKDVENRTRRSGHRGLTLIHASAGMESHEFDGFRAFLSARGLAPLCPFGPDDVQRGGIVGWAEVVDCVDDSSSPWFMGPVGFMLRNARPLPFIPCRGRVAPLFWKPDPDVQLRVLEARAFLTKSES